jgi:cytochrome P450
MSEFMRKPLPIIEERGPGWFAPARPVPNKRRPGLFNTIRLARYSQISIWEGNDYQSMHGSIRILRRQVILANSPESVKYFMATAHENYERKSPQLRRALEPLIGTGLFISSGEIWKRRRPLVVDIANKNRLPAFAPSMEGVAQETLSRWLTRKSDEVFDVLIDMGDLTAKIIARTVFGNNISQEAVDDVLEGVNGYMRHVDSVNLAYFLGNDDGSPVKLRANLKRSQQRLHKVVDGVIEHHLAGHGDESSMMQSLIRYRAKNPDADLSLAALRDEAATIFGAGQETTSTVLTWAWYLLANAPWVEEAVLAEIERVCGSRAPTVADVPNLEWCRAVIDETLRLYPPVPMLARQAKNADEFMDLKVEAGSLVIVTPWLLHRARDLWDQPERFMPERFMNGNRPTPYTYVPFAIGPRLCAGLSFGLTESVLALAILIQRFKVRVAPGTKVEPVCRLSLRPMGGLPVTIERRF